MSRTFARLSPLALSLVALAPVAAQRPTLGAEPKAFVSQDAPVIALVHARVIDGTGAPARTGQTLVIRDGNIAAVGDSASTPIPAGAQVMDLAGKSVIPGLVQMHEHLFYPSGAGTVYNSQAYSFPRLYLAGGVTTMRTAGNMNGYADLNLARAIAAGTAIGPAIDATAPYLEGPGFPVYQVKALKNADDAQKMVAQWADEGATSFKAYMHISRAELAAAAKEAHKRGLKITGHLCSVTFREAAAAGIDDLEHGFVVATDFVKDKKPDECPAGNAQQRSFIALDPESAEAKSLIADLVKSGVAITSTLTVFETFAPKQPRASDRALDMMLPEAKRQYLTQRQRIEAGTDSSWTVMLRKEMQMERAFFKAGGQLLTGTDPTGYGGVVAGFANQRALELLVEGGLTPLEAIQVSTLNAARYMGKQARIGSIAVGKQADLVIVRGDPSSRIADIEQVEVVFKQGIGYDPEKLITAAKGQVGLH